jgi:hypothetical protein
MASFFKLLDKEILEFLTQHREAEVFCSIFRNIRSFCVTIVEQNLYERTLKDYY